MAYAFAVPIPPGKTDAVRRLIQESLSVRKSEYDDMQRRSGVTEESYWLQHDPELGDLLIVVSSSDQTDFLAIMANPQTPFDRWYRDQIRDIFGFDPDQAVGERNELLGSWPG
ncbi:MAG TPA: hypothetical protein VEZ12_02895 [Herpetosiphonaceae bacterium]|nr:hypothetical protein [Herpetosiphonaceae bacterium]